MLGLMREPSSPTYNGAGPDLLFVKVFSIKDWIDLNSQAKLEDTLSENIYVKAEWF